MTLPTYHFDLFKLRPATDADDEISARWIAADPYHDGTRPEFWRTQAPGINSFLLVDAEGPVFFFRIQLTKHAGQLKIYIQFAPTAEVAKERTIKGLTQGMAWFEKFARDSSFTELVTDSKNSALIHFLQSRLGFIQATRGDQLTKSI